MATISSDKFEVHEDPDYPGKFILRTSASNTVGFDFLEQLVKSDPRRGFGIMSARTGTVRIFEHIRHDHNVFVFKPISDGSRISRVEVLFEPGSIIASKCWDI